MINKRSERATIVNKIKNLLSLLNQYEVVKPGT